MASKSRSGRRGRKKSGEILSFDVVAGGVIRKLRIKQEMSQSQVAAEIGLSYQQLQKYEVGSNSMNLGRIYQLAEVFKIAPETLFASIIMAMDEKRNTAPKIVNLQSQEANYKLEQEASRVLTKMKDPKLIKHWLALGKSMIDLKPAG